MTPDKVEYAIVKEFGAWWECEMKFTVGQYEPGKVEALREMCLVAWENGVYTERRRWEEKTRAPF